MPFRKLNRKKTSPSFYANPGSILFFLEPYCEWLRVRSYAENTIELRSLHIRHFTTFCEERGILSPEEVSRQVVERYQRHLYHLIGVKTKKPFSIRQQISYLGSLRGFFKWLTKERHLLYNPASEMELPRLGRHLPAHVLNAKEAEAVISTPDITTSLGIRDRALMEVLYSTGIRRAELAGLLLYDVDFDNRTVFIRQGKGKKDRMVPIGERACLWLEKYLQEVRGVLVAEPDGLQLFLTPSGEGLSMVYLTELVRRYVVESGVGKKGSCHLFRHTMATLMLEGGADVRYIQAMLGHSQLASTEIYTHVSIRKLKEVHERTHPGIVHKISFREEQNKNQESNYKVT